MPVTTDSRTTLLDYAKMTDPDGRPAQVYEVMNQVLQMLEDAPAYPSNAPFGNRTTIRSSLPTVQTAKINRGTPRSKGTTTQVTDAIGIIDGLSEVDTRQRDVVGEVMFNAERMKEDKGWMEAMAEFVGNLLVYGNTALDEAAFDGLAPRMATKNQGTDRTISQVWSLANVSGQAVVGGDASSIYVVDWGETGASLIFPPNVEQSGGMMVRNLGDLRVTDKNSNPFMAAVTQFLWYVGLAVKDTRHIARLGDIDISDANIANPLQGTILNVLIDLLTEMIPAGGCTRVLYAPTRVHAAYWKQAINKSNAALAIADYLGKPTLHVWGYPMRRHDQISVAESALL
jgi:hypothetical protein